MDSSNLQGVLIQWLRPKTEIDFENVLPTDWQFLKTLQCPLMDGSAFELPNGQEWLANENGEQPYNYDPRLFVLNSDTRPTNRPHSEYPNYNTYFTKYDLVKRTVEEVSASIIQEEKMANNSLDTEADVNTMNTFALGYLIAKANGLTPTQEQENATTRLADVQMKKNKNAQNRLLLISQLEAGNFNIDISSGWEGDNISLGGVPFSN